jgi:hypothetical protein
MPAPGSLRTRRREHGQHPDQPTRPPGKSGLTFRLELAKLVRAGRKTETRRVVTPGQPYRLQPGDDVAVQPGRGKRALCRVTIESVERERLGDLDDRAARAEGFDSRDEFFAYWRDLHGYALPGPQLALLERLAVADPSPADAFQLDETDSELRARLGALRRRGYATTGRDGVWTITDQGADYLDDPSSAVDLDVPVWVVRFSLVRELDGFAPRLLAAAGGDYTSSPGRALAGVPVTLPSGRETTMPEPEVIDYKRSGERQQAAERLREEALIDELEHRLARARQRAKEKGLDISPFLRTVSSKIERVERFLEQEGAT